MGNFNPQGAPAGRFKQTITVMTARSRAGANLPLRAGPDRVSAFTIRRLAVPMPAFLPSVNQIGFDSYDWIASTISRTGSTVLLWVIGAYRGPRGIERVDPRSAFSFPLAGRYRHGSVILSSPSVPLTFSFGLVPLRRFELRGTLDRALSFRPGVSLYSETVCATVPNYGPELAFTGICNPGGVLAASGTLISSAYRGPASVRPRAVHLGAVRLTHPSANQAGRVSADLLGSGRPLARRHVVALLLSDARSGLPVTLDYRAQTRPALDAAGRITGVRLVLPAGTRLPSAVRAYVIVDAFPVGARVL
jgi:hypothetical protein